MHALTSGRRTLVALLATTTLGLGLIAPGAAGAAAPPQQIGPKSGAVLALGSRPVFKVKDPSAQADALFITISTSKKRSRDGDLKRTKVGNFASMKRKGGVFSYKTENFTFPTWFMVRPGTYYWQAFRIDCSAGTANDCHIHTKIRSFKVR